MSLRNDVFYLPYHFVPVTGMVNGHPVVRVPGKHVKKGCVGAGAPGEGARHDVWVSGHRSGRIVCRLTTETPTFVGGKRFRNGKDAIQKVLPAMDADEKVVIPANSLRGMVGAVVESISQSAMRILQDRVHSVRKQADGKRVLSAIGLVGINPKNGRFVLQPQTLPVLKRRVGDSDFEVPAKWVRAFALQEGGIDGLEWFLPVYINGYDVDGEDAVVKSGSVVADVHGRDFDIFDFYEVKCPKKIRAELYRRNGRFVLVPRPGAPLKIKPRGQSEFLLGWEPVQGIDNVKPIKQEENDVADSSGWVCGRLRIFPPVTGPQRLPKTKKHEFFVPDAGDDAKRILISEEAIGTLDQICDARHRDLEQLPFLQFGTESGADRFEERERDRLNGLAPRSWLREGDLVCFDVDDNGQLVTEISFSSIWRQAIEGSIHKWFARVGADAVPFSDSRESLTPAEVVLGVVGENTEKSSEQESGKLAALASRVRFSSGKLFSGGSGRTASVPLQILASPKPPSAAFYFPAAPGRVEIKPYQHRPAGRKCYLHHSDEQIRLARFQTGSRREELEKQKVMVEPLPVGARFEFVIDFENLALDELRLLIAALRPSSNFRHRLGMGKPLGMGSVRLDVLAIGMVDRLSRYHSLGGRYCELWLNPGHPGLDATLHPMEARAARDLGVKRIPVDEFSIERCVNSALVDRDSLGIACRLGERLGGAGAFLQRGVPVCYPRTVGQMRAWLKGDARVAEEKLYEWNVENDRVGSDHRQVLYPVDLQQPFLEPFKAMEKKNK